MTGFDTPYFAKQLIEDRQARLQRDAGRSRLYREAKRLRRQQRRTP